MNALGARILLLQHFYPQICLFLLAALKSSGIAALGGSAAAFLRRRSAAARCWVWRCVLLGILALPVFNFGPGMIREARLPLRVRPDNQAAGAFYREAQSLRVLISDEEIAQVKAQKIADHPAPPWELDDSRALTAADLRPAPWASIEARLPGIWWAVAAFLTAVTVCRITIGAAWLRRNAIPAPAGIVSRGAEIALELAIESRPEVRLIRNLPSPLLLGFRRPEILLPENSPLWSAPKLRAVLLHELAHWKRRDHLWQHLGRLAACLFWWNPLVKIAMRQMRGQAEEAADDAVLLHQSEAAAYAAVLAEIAAGQPGPKLSAAGVSMTGNRPLEKRLQALMAGNPWRGKVGRLTGAFLAVLLLVFVAGSSVYLGYADTIEGSGQRNRPSLTAAQRDLLQRLVDANTERLRALHFLHLKIESTQTEQGPAGTLTSPQPQKMEAWLDVWTGLHRAEFRPSVTRWIDGAAPYYIHDTTQINNGKNFYSFEPNDDPGRLRGSSPQGLDFYLGLDETSGFIRDCKAMLSGGSLDQGDFQNTIDQVTRNGKTLIRIRHNFIQHGRVVQEQTYLADPAQDDALVFSELGFPVRKNDIPVQWIAKEFRAAGDGRLYPSFTERISPDGKVKIITDSRITSLELLTALPPGITDLPKAAADQFVAGQAGPIRWSDIDLSFIDGVENHPVPSVAIEVTINSQPVQNLTADAQGHLLLSLPKEEVTKLSIVTKASGFTSKRIAWTRFGDPLQLPQSYQVKLSPVAPIAGKVVDEQGRPLAGAEVEIGLWPPGGSTNIFRDQFELERTVVKTGSDGMWTFEDTPADLGGLCFRVSLPGYQATTDSGTEDFRTATGLPYEVLRDGSLVTTLKRGLELSGRVLDSSGKPVAKCHLTIGRDRWGMNLPTADTDANGSYTFKGLSPRLDWITAEAAGCQPFAAEVSLPAAGPLNITLKAGRILRGRVVKEDGTPCAELNVTADTWGQLRTLTFATQTDAGGRFVWTGAPAEPVSFSFGACQNREFLAGLWLTASEGEQVIVIKPALQLVAEAVDAATGQHIQPVRVIPGRLVGADTTYWERDAARTYADGKINWQTSYNLGQPRLFQIEAEGYQPFQTETFETNQKQVKETFRLTKAN